MFYCPKCNNTFDITKKKIINEMINQQNRENEINKTNESSESFNISSETIEMVGGVSIKNIINKILNNTIEEEELKKINEEAIINDKEYKKLNKKNKEYVYNKIRELRRDHLEKKIEKMNDNIDTGYFICNNCKYYEKIKSGTMIFKKSSENVSKQYKVENYKVMKNSKILPITREYICPNKECPSHKNIKLKEAKFFRINNSFKMKYICMACEYVF